MTPKTPGTTTAAAVPSVPAAEALSDATDTVTEAETVTEAASEVVEISEIAVGPSTREKFHAVLVPEGERTTDGRYIVPGSLTWRSLPIPLQWAKSHEGAHKGSVTVGRIEEVYREGNEIRARGTMDLGSPEGREAHRLIKDQTVRWLSIDLEVLEDELTEDGDDMLMTVTSGRIMGATIVPFPAFPGAVIALADHVIPPASPDGRPAAIPPDIVIPSPIAATHSEDETFAITDAPWNGSASRFSDEEWRRATAACEGLSDAPKTDCFLPHHEPSGAVNRRGVHAAASRFNQTQRRNKEKARAHLASHYRRDLKETPPPVLEAASLAASAAARTKPPREWFENPGLKSLTPPTLTRDGRFYGHAAPWNQCHIGFNDACVMAPRSNSHYAYFMHGETEVADCDCDSIPTGPVTLGTLHARPPLSAQAAIEHYENTGLVVADVCVGEDEFGVWFAGALRPEVSESQRAALRGSALSGDWRRIGGNLELVGLLAVNVPGFPIPRLSVGRREGYQISLVAAGIPREAPVSPTAFFEEVTAADLLAELKAQKDKPADAEGVVEPAP